VAQELQQAVQALREAQEQVLEQAQEVVQALGLAAAQLESLAQAQKGALEWDLQPQARQAVEQVELLAQGPLVEL
jgi:hypothetical protein